MIREYEVDVVRGPAHHEDHCGEGKHLDDLLLVVPALGEGRLGHQQPQGGLVATPQVSPHLWTGRSFWSRSLKLTLSTCRPFIALGGTNQLF